MSKIVNTLFTVMLDLPLPFDSVQLPEFDGLTNENVQEMVFEKLNTI